MTCAPIPEAPLAFAVIVNPGERVSILSTAACGCGKQHTSRLALEGMEATIALGGFLGVVKGVNYYDRAENVDSVAQFYDVIIGSATGGQ